jgi:hypothetical protein
MTWFDSLTGFRETSPEQVRANLSVDGVTLTSRVNGRSYICGRLETPSLAELRERVRESRPAAGSLSLREVVGDVQALHADPANAGALFQVASQFNLLEMASPSVTPEQGVGIYEHDHTQGPACAIAAGAGTIYRAYFAPVNGQTGQSAGSQIDCLVELGAALGNAANRLWEMRNGYALPSRAGLNEISERLRACGEDELDRLRLLLRVGIQWQTQVTIRGAGHTVSQVYGSALPVAYAGHPPALWEPFARLVLEASYEAVLCAALLNPHGGGSRRVFLTLLGGGAFGNPEDWILAAITRALALYRNFDLEIAVVSYGAAKPSVRRLVDQFQGQA